MRTDKAESTGLKSVDKLVITFLVDNTLEWFGKLPPGFTNEIRNHLTEHNPRRDPLTGAPFLELDDYCCGAHGFSALIVNRTKFLFGYGTHTSGENNLRSYVFMMGTVIPGNAGDRVLTLASDFI